ncbi:MAG: DNA polymerase III subunit gamma/tau [Pseudomonadota bacterium]
MSYQVLARKWRPKVFDDLVGQDHVVQALRHALSSDRLHHAYLFTGTRGVGKTTIARILAKALNCEQGVTANPCPSCSTCVEIDEGRSVDLIEVDAASRTKVEDTRELLENVQYAPTRSRFKVYLIDEVHMLSSHSFNALLKTLEEPPAHVKFLLATTDPQKLPATVLSRCLQFSLKNMSAERVVDHLGKVLDAENIPYDDAALWQLGRAADGSMRDALSLTDQAIAFGGGSLEESSVNELLGTVDRSHIHSLLDALNRGDMQELLRLSASMAELGVNFVAAVDELCSILHRCAVSQALPEALDKSQSDAKTIVALARQLTAEDVQLFYELAQRERSMVLGAADPKAAFEMLLLRLHAFRPVAVLDTAMDASAFAAVPTASSKDAETSSVGENSPVESDSGTVSSARLDKAATREPVALADPEPGEISRGKKSEPPSAARASPDAARAERSSARTETSALRKTAAEKSVGVSEWHEVLDALSLRGSVASIASHCVLQSREGAEWNLRLDERHAQLFSDRHTEQLAAALSQLLEESIKIHISVGVVSDETPAARTQRLTEERLAAAEREIESDPRVAQLLSEFEGTLVTGSVTVDRH